MPVDIQTYMYICIDVHILNNFNVNSMQDPVNFCNLTKLFHSSS